MHEPNINSHMLNKVLMILTSSDYLQAFDNLDDQVNLSLSLLLCYGWAFVCSVHVLTLTC